MTHRYLRRGPAGSAPRVPAGLTICAIAVLGVVLVACAESDPAAEAAARLATEPWLALMDAGEHQRCWEAAAPVFREQVTAAAWAAQARAIRDPLGEPRGRELSATTFKTNPWGAPEGRYVIVVYASRWDNGDIYETLSMREQADGAWRLVGYHVKQRY